MEGKEDIWKMALPELICIKCDEGGNLLVCYENDCLIAVHEECIGCPARFDDAGHFYCPHCFFRQAIRESQEAWKNATSKKEALAIFEMVGHEKNLGVNNRSEAERLHQSEGGVNVNMKTSHDRKSRHGSDVVLNNSIQIDKDAGDGIRRDTANISPCRETDISRIAERCDTLNISENEVHDQNDNSPNVIISKHTNLGPVTDRDTNVPSLQQFEPLKDITLDQAQHTERVVDHKLSGSSESHQEDECTKDFNEVQDPSTQSRRKISSVKSQQEHKINTMEEEKEVSQSSRGSTGRKRTEKSDLSDTDSGDISVRSKRAKPNYKNNGKQKFQRMNPPRKSSSAQRTIKAPDEKVDSSRSKQSKQPSANRVNQIVVSGKRKRLMWRQEEEEMLKEGVQKFSSGEKRNLPWRKILEFGRHVFDESRTPIDLKDKWRNNLAK